MNPGSTAPKAATALSNKAKIRNDQTPISAESPTSVIDFIPISILVDEKIGREILEGMPLKRQRSPKRMSSLYNLHDPFSVVKKVCLDPESVVKRVKRVRLAPVVEIVVSGDDLDLTEEWPAS